MAKTLAIIFGIILVLLGLMGFISNPLVGLEGALFEADTLHNVIHVVLGAVLLVVAFWSADNSVRWLKIVGAVTFLLGLLGVFVAGDLLGIVVTNAASNWLHVVAGAVIFIAGMYGKDRVEGMAAMPPTGTAQPM